MSFLTTSFLSPSYRGSRIYDLPNIYNRYGDTLAIPSLNETDFSYLNKYSEIYFVIFSIHFVTSSLFVIWIALYGLSDIRTQPFADLTKSFLFRNREPWFAASNNIKRHTAHTILSWSNHKQWQMDHTSDYKIKYMYYHNRHKRNG